MDKDIFDIEAEQEQQAKSQQLKAIERQKDLQWMMATKQGRRVLHRLIDDCGVFRPSNTGNSQTFFNEGRRSVGLAAFHEIMAISPESFVTMWRESMEEPVSGSANDERKTV